MHNNNDLAGEYNTYHLFHLVIQFCEALKYESFCSKGSLLAIY